MAFSHHQVFRRLRTSRNRRLIRGTLVCSFFAVWFAWVSLPRMVIPNELMLAMQDSINDVVVGSSEPIRNFHSRDPLSPSSIEGWYVGGFPMDAYHQVRRDEGRRFTIIPLALVVNLLTASLLIGGGLLIATAPDPRKSFFSILRFHRSDCPRTAVLLGGVSLALAASTVLHFSRCHANNRIPLRFASVSVQSSIRHPFFAAAPKWFRSPWTHVVQISLAGRHRAAPSFGAGDTIRLANYPGLQMISLQGELSRETLDDVAGVPLLQSLAWHQPSSVEDVGRIIERIDTLESLDIRVFRRHPLPAFRDGDPKKQSDPKQVARSALNLKHHPRLRRLNLVNYPSSAIDLDSLSNNPSLTEFCWQIEGKPTAPIRLHGCPELTAISINTMYPQKTEATVEIRTMPKLHSLTLPGNCPTDLTLVDLPALRYINTHYGDEFSQSGEDWYDHYPQIAGLTVLNATNLSALEFTTQKLQRWEVRGCPLLRSVSLSNARDFFPYGRFEPSDSSDRNRNDAVDSLAPFWDWFHESQPINSLCLSDFSVRNVDFSGLSNQNFFRSIWMIQCDATASQLEQLSQIPSMRELRAESVPVNEQTVANLLAANDRWEALLIDWSTLSKIEIRNQPYLKSAFGNLELRGDEIVLENVPRLESYLFSSRSIRKLHVVAAPRLGGIFINGPLPKDARLEGLSKLNHLTANGGVLSQRHLTSLKECGELQTLSLPGCEIPNALIDHLTRWPKLSVLDFRGVQVAGNSAGPVPFSDQHAAAFGSMNSLMRVNLDRTNISGRTIRVLANCPSLQALSVKGCRLSKQDLEPLASRRLLMELGVSNRMEVPPELENIALRTNAATSPDELSTFDLTWNSIFTGELKRRVQARLERNRANRRPRFDDPVMSRGRRPRQLNSPTP